MPFNHHSRKTYFIIAVALVVLVSGCAQQATIVIDSYAKVQSLKNTTGYVAEYDMNFKFDLTEKTKQSLSASGSANSLEQLSAMPPISLKVSAAEKSGKMKSSIDFSGLSSLASQSAPPFSVFSVYSDKNGSSVCITTAVKTLCTRQNIGDISQASPAAAAQLAQYQQFTDQTPDKILSKFKSLYDKGALTLGPTSKGTVIGRECDKISYTISDFSKMDPEDMVNSLGSLGGQTTGTGQKMSKEQLAQATSMFQKIIKSISEDLCLDRASGVLLGSSSSITVDMSDFIKGLASSLGGQAKSGKVPDELSFIMKVDLTATSFKPVADDAEFSLPAGAEIVSLAEFGSALSPGGMATPSPSPQTYNSPINQNDANSGTDAPDSGQGAIDISANGLYAGNLDYAAGDSKDFYKVHVEPNKTANVRITKTIADVGLSVHAQETLEPMGDAKISIKKGDTDNALVVVIENGPNPEDVLIDLDSTGATPYTMQVLDAG